MLTDLLHSGSLQSRIHCRRLRALGLGAALALLAGATWAQPAPVDADTEVARMATIADADKTVAKSLVDEGDEQFAAGAYGAAVDRYRGAHALIKVPTTGWELARALEAALRLREAERILEWIVAYPTWDGQPPPFAEARDKAQKQLEALRPRIPKLAVAVTNPHPDMVLTIDGTVAEAGTPVALDPGSHEVELVAPEVPRLLRRVELTEGASKTLTLTLASSSQAGPPSTGEPGPERTVPVWTWIGFGVTGVGAVVGGITGGLSLSRASAFKSTQLPNGNYPESERGTQRESLTLAHIATGSFVVAGVGAAVGLTGIILIYAVEPEAPDQALHLRVGPGHLSFAGSF